MRVGTPCAVKNKFQLPTKSSTDVQAIYTELFFVLTIAGFPLLTLRQSAPGVWHSSVQGPAWFDEAGFDGSAHAYTECSTHGHCERGTGVCVCHDGFTGDACQVQCV